MNKSEKSLVGKSISVHMLDRSESEFNGQLISLEERGVFMSYSEHGNNYITLLPWNNINYLEHKVSRNGTKEKEQNKAE